MGIPQTVHPQRLRSREAWASPAGFAISAKRDFVDLENGSAMEGSAAPLRCKEHGAFMVPILGRAGCAATHDGGIGSGVAPTREAQPERSVYRRDFQPGEKRGLHVGKTKRGKGTKIMAIADGNGLPLALCTASASPAEVRLVRQTLQALSVGLPERLIGDKAYDSDALDCDLDALGVEMIAPNRRNRSRTQDGRPLRRYKRRWKIERLFAWLGHNRRLIVRYERHVANFLGFLQLAACKILMRHIFVG